MSDDMLIDFTSGDYTVVDNWIFRTNLSVNDKMVYIVLKMFAWKGKNMIFPSHASIAKSASISVASVKRSIDNLVRVGLVKKVQRKAKSNIYVLLDPGASRLAQSELPIAQSELTIAQSELTIAQSELTIAQSELRNNTKKQYKETHTHKGRKVDKRHNGDNGDNGDVEKCVCEFCNRFHLKKDDVLQIVATHQNRCEVIYDIIKLSKSKSIKNPIGFLRYALKNGVILPEETSNKKDDVYKEDFNAWKENFINQQFIEGNVMYTVIEMKELDNNKIEAVCKAFEKGKEERDVILEFLDRYVVEKCLWMGKKLDL